VPPHLPLVDPLLVPYQPLLPPLLLLLPRVNTERASHLPLIEPLLVLLLCCLLLLLQRLTLSNRLQSSIEQCQQAVLTQQYS
jgi:hypothetical protein